jgi:glycosyltransferase involved in cell wall biosynthesis
MQDSLNYELTLVVPAYNEEARIGHSLDSLAQFADSREGGCEVLIVEDGSTDRTAALVEAFIARRGNAPSPFRLLSYGRNRGKGYAVQQGLLAAEGRYVVFTDTDLSAPIDQVPLLLAPLQRGADIAIASRRTAGAVVEALPLKRRIMGRIFSWISRRIVLGTYKDTQCGFKGYRHQAAKKIASLQTISGYTFDVEHLLLAEKLGYKVEEVPVRWVYTEGSQVNSFRDSLKMLRDLMALRREFKEHHG